jgi:hypothetical protein
MTLAHQKKVPAVKAVMITGVAAGTPPLVAVKNRARAPEELHFASSFSHDPKPQWLSSSSTNKKVQVIVSTRSLRTEDLNPCILLPLVTLL